MGNLPPKGWKLPPSNEEEDERAFEFAECITHEEFMLLSDFYGERNLIAALGINNRAIYYWKRKGFPKSVNTYIRLCIKWEQYKAVVDPERTRRMSKKLRQVRKDRSLRELARKAEEVKFENKKRSNAEHYHANIRKRRRLNPKKRNKSKD